MLGQVKGQNTIATLVTDSSLPEQGEAEGHHPDQGADTARLVRGLKGL